MFGRQKTRTQTQTHSQTSIKIIHMHRDMAVVDVVWATAGDRSICGCLVFRLKMPSSSHYCLMAIVESGHTYLLIYIYARITTQQYFIYLITNGRICCSQTQKLECVVWLLKSATGKWLVRFVIKNNTHQINLEQETHRFRSHWPIKTVCYAVRIWLLIVR